jgi:acetyltransferase
MLDSLLTPRTVAIVGASAAPGKVGQAILANMISAGFPGRIVPVNPKADTLQGLPCVHSLAELDEKPDLVVIAVPTAAVKGAVADAIAAGAGAVIVITAGFKETGPEGAALEAEITALCRHAGVRLMGPNCLGLLNTQARLNASFAKQTPSEGSISVLSQSGALCTAILD